MIWFYSRQPWYYSISNTTVLLCSLTYQYRFIEIKIVIFLVIPIDSNLILSLVFILVSVIFEL